MSEAQVYAKDITKLYEKIQVANNLIVQSLRNTDFEKSDLIYSTELLASTTDEIYLSAIVDKEGKGVSSGIVGDIDISKQSYFEVITKPEIIFVESDGLLGRKAFVSAMPIVKEQDLDGIIFSYVEVKKLEELLPEKNYDRETFITLIDDEGEVIFNNGLSCLGDSTNLFDSLHNVNFDDSSYEKVVSRIKNGINQKATIHCDEESRILISVPIRELGWTYVEAVNVSYVDRLVEERTKKSYDMVRNLVIAVFISIAIVVGLLIRNKIIVEEQNRRLENKADTDLLTGVNNKLATERKIQEFIDENPGTQSLFILLDIDNFKKINDTKGHAFGDLVIKSLGEQLSKEFRSSDIIGRIGGDEFVVFLKNLSTDELLEKESKRILKFFEEFSVGDYAKYSPTASIGGAVFSKDGEDFHSLYKAADAALYAAKKNGKNQFVFYTSDLSNAGRENKK